MRLTTDLIAYTVERMPRWNPINICSYHLQEAGATPVQELAFSLCTAIAVLDAVRDSGQVPPERFGRRRWRMSFFVNAGVRFVEEMCKMRAFVELWDELTRERYGVDRRADAPVPLRRAGQLPRPHRGAAREQRAAHRAGDAGRHAVQGRAGPRRAAAGVERGAGAARGRGTSSGRCGCSRCWRTSPTCSSTTTCSTGSLVVRGEGRRAGCRGARGDGPGPGDGWRGGGGRDRLHEAAAGGLTRAPGGPHRVRRGEVVGVNRFTETEPTPLTADLDDRCPGRRRRRRSSEPSTRCDAWRERARPGRRCRRRSTRLRADAKIGREPGARDAGVRPGRRDDGGVGRGAARGVRRVPRPDRGVGRRCGTRTRAARERLADVRERGTGRPATSSAPGCGCWSASRAWTGTPTAPSRSRCAPATPASRSSTRASGSRPPQIVAAAVAEDVHCVGLSILSGSHLRAGAAPCSRGCARRAPATCRSSSAGSSRRRTPGC